MKFMNWLRACVVGFADWLVEGCAHDWSDIKWESSNNGFMRFGTKTCKKCAK